MKEPEREDVIKHILVALDASPHSLSALETAAELAASLRAELSGLFVEDINLLRMAELPFTREVGFFSGSLRRLDAQQVERQFRAQAGWARRALTRIAERERIRCSFQVTRGRITSELLAAAVEADLIILGKAGWSRQRRLGSTARAMLSQAPASALILQRGVRLRMPVLVLYDGSRGAQRALATAAQLAQGKKGSLIILILADRPIAAQNLQQEVAEWLGERKMQARPRWLPQADVAKLCQVARDEGSGVLVLHGDTPQLQGEVLETLLNEIECPVLLVR
ncbi:MAG: universal stress protein [Chloroflexota bacterium]|nr:universal stress protein [Chloroflexota bacterium]